uniref:Uncharacterized protein n=1 Tax=Octopus bimaculoides TaxID=37653 RepID=A0A0L8GRP5_OCTBM|eukprot:XP_014778921.1 PREDICTED: uncharacterized protein LOC106875345 [Octopus bimaculoides]
MQRVGSWNNGYRQWIDQASICTTEEIIHHLQSAVIFRPDGAPLGVVWLLNPWTGRGCPALWPLKSRDIACLDLWDYIKDSLLYKISKTHDLKGKIRRAISNIDEG